MIAFQSPTDPSRAHMTYVPGPMTQDHLATAPTEVILGIGAILEPHLKMFAGLLDATLVEGPTREQTLNDLDEALREITQRALIRLRGSKQ